jgi:nucleotide-binding universal stress UspA family protein
MTARPDLLVCATDFSDQSASALEWAAAFARREGARVDLVHVLPAPTRSREALAADEATYEAARLEDARARLSAVAAATARASGVSVEPQVLRGEPHTCIVEHARLHGARAVVVGAGGGPLVERWVLGSVAERTVRSAVCPVVVVPRRKDGRSPIGAGEAGAGPALKALVGLEGADGAPELVRFVADLRQRGRCDVKFLHLYWPVEEYARLGLRGARNPLEVDPDVVKHLAPTLHWLIDGLPGQGEVALDIQPALGAPAANLARAAEDARYDLLIVGAHQRHGFSRLLEGSIAQSLAHQATNVPVVCVPVPPVVARAGTDRRPLPRILTVLAPTDLSDVGNAAIPHAYALLRATGGVVELCHVHEHGLPNPAYAYDLPDQLTTAERHDIEKQLRALVPAGADALGITTHVSIIDGGKAGETIVAAAERLNVDAISLGTHGRGGLARALLGSVADAVVRHARRPVFVVPIAR